MEPQVTHVTRGGASATVRKVGVFSTCPESITFCHNVELATLGVVGRLTPLVEVMFLTQCMLMATSLSRMRLASPRK